MGADESVDLCAAELPVIVEIGDHCFHEWLAELDRLLLVAQAIEQDGERKLLWAPTLVAPLEAEFGEALDLVSRVVLVSVDNHDDSFHRTPALLRALLTHSTTSTRNALLIVHNLGAG